MEQARLSINLREVKTKGQSNAIRRTGSVPAIVYGHKMANVPIQFSEKSLRQILASGGENVIINMDMGSGSSETVIIKEIQIDPLSRRIIHADFMRVSMEELITTHVPITLIGTAPGVGEGGILEFLHREVRVECQAGKIPEHIEVDVSSLNMGDQIRIGDLKTVEDITVLDDLSTTIVVVAAPALQKEEEAVAEVEQVEEKEPEVIRERRKEEEKEE